MGILGRIILASNWYLYIGVFLVCTGLGTVVGILMLVFYFWDDLGKKLKFSQYNDNTFNINNLNSMSLNSKINVQDMLSLQGSFNSDEPK